MNKSDVYNDYYNNCHGFELFPYLNKGDRQNENGVLFQAEFLLTQHIRCTVDQLDIQAMDNTIRKIKIADGLYNRGYYDKYLPYKIRRTISQDNIDGVVFGEMLTGSSAEAVEVAFRGLTRFGFYNNVWPRLTMFLNPGNGFAWLSAAGSIYAVLAYLFLPIFIINYLITVNKEAGNTSSKKLYLLELYTLQNKSKLHKALFIDFCKRMTKMYGEEFIFEIYKIYFKDENHPNRIYAKGIIFDGEKLCLK